MKILWGVCGSFCNHAEILNVIRQMAVAADLNMIVSENTARLDTRFGTAAALMEQLAEVSGKPVMTRLDQAERAGPLDFYDAMVIAPATATVISKLALGIYDHPVVLAAKAMLRNRRPIILAVASNDLLGISGANLMRLLQMRHVYIVPFYQDDHVQKPNSLISAWTLIEPTLAAALRGEQLQPILYQKGAQQ